MQHMAGETMVNLPGIWNKDLQMVNFFKTPRSVWRSSYVSDDDELNLDITATHFWSGLWHRDALIDGEIATSIISHSLSSLSHFQKLNITEIFYTARLNTPQGETLIY